MRHTHSYVRHHPEQLLFGIHSRPSCAGGPVVAVRMWPVGTGWLRSCFCGRWRRTCLLMCTQPSVHTHALLRAAHVTHVLEVPGPGRNRWFLNSILRVFLRLNCLTRQLFIGRVMQIGRSPRACRAVPDSSGQAGLAQCAAWASERPTVPIVVCGLAVWFLSGVPQVLLFACYPIVRQGKGQGGF